MSAVVVGLVSPDYRLTIYACVFAYAVGIVPTILKVWKRPREEPLDAWLIWLLGSLPLLYLQWGDWSFESIATPAIIVLEEMMIVGIILYARAVARTKSFALAT